VYDEIQVRREDAARLIAAYYKAKGRPVEISQFKEAGEFTGAFRENSFSAVFIGIYGMRCVDVAWVIRSRDKKCPLVIISRNGDYSLEGYRLEAADYIVEPLVEEKFYKTLDILENKQ
jgi:two-component system response regulator LytT